LAKQRGAYKGLKKTLTPERGGRAGSARRQRCSESRPCS
jgi:hypothetical protein